MRRMREFIDHVQRASDAYKKMPNSRVRRGRMGTWRYAWRMTEWL